MCIESVWAMLLFLGMKLYEYRQQSSLWQETMGNWVFLLECRTAKASGVSGAARCIGAVQFGAAVKRRGVFDDVFQHVWGATLQSTWAYPILQRRMFRRPVDLPHKQWLTRLPEAWNSVCDGVLGTSVSSGEFYVQQWLRYELARRVLLTDQISDKWRSMANVAARQQRARAQKKRYKIPKQPLILSASQKIYMGI